MRLIIDDFLHYEWLDDIKREECLFLAWEAVSESE